MEVLKKKRSSSIVNKLERYLKKNKGRVTGIVAPVGCFSVYVGPEKQRFVIQTKSANHPLFKMLLDDAEMEYGFRNDGPLLIPCEVDFFCKVLAEIVNGDDYDDKNISNLRRVQPNCGSYFSPRRSTNRVFSSTYRLLPDHVY